MISLSKRKQGRRYRVAGFTMIELFIGLIIVSVGMLIAVPSFQGMVARNRIATQVNTLLTSLNTARSEASRTGSTVSVQAVVNPAGPNTDEFGGGFCVVIGTPGDCQGTAIRQFPALAGESTLDSEENVSVVSFDSLGALTGTNDQQRIFDLCYPGQQGRRVIITLIGRSKSHRPDDPVAGNRPTC